MARETISVRADVSAVMAFMAAMPSVLSMEPRACRDLVISAFLKNLVDFEQRRDAEGIVLIGRPSVDLVLWCSALRAAGASGQAA